MKYVIFENSDGKAHVIPNSLSISHKSLGGIRPQRLMELCPYNERLDLGQVVSAGFFQISEDGKPKVWGRSESLSMEIGREMAAREQDLDIILAAIRTADY